MAAATASTSFHIRRSFQYNGNLQNSSPKRVKAFQSPTIITASLEARRPQNVSGEFFVDHTCIDCDTCRWMAPALLSCPTSSIHTEKPPHDILEVQKTFPIPIDEHTLLGVYHCGYHSDKSFGAASYLIVRAEGNILVDSPRYTTKLENNLKMLGGARYMFLTHSDDVADHEKWSNHLGCERILHLLEVDHSTAAVEIKLEGSGPWNLGDDVTLVHTPGHTEGSVCLLYKPHKVLFTGDHFAMGELGWTIAERYNKFSVPKQLSSVKLMLDLDFEWMLPGHGRRTKFRDVEDKNLSLRAFLETKMQLL
ncbi:uncharacterized protein LOC125829322 isoform X2 [Solanum verrucosum]|uniref:uncharacterized protein LOC125829322 isoform X2 n=1 Tax=Solanum verrucosum TaxID=315347 RepID=UPI0020D09371|nr:uncharacterized protein LOC125829322 isoform X2 [Solanum verrucosum]